MTVPPSRKIGRSLASFSSAGVRARALVGVNGQGLAFGLGHVDCHELVVEAAGLVGGHRAAVRFERERVLILARDRVALGHVLARLAHRLGRVQPGHARVHEAPADRGVGQLDVAARKAALGLEGHERRARHGLDAAGQHQVRLAEPDLAGALHRGLEPGGAEAVDGHARGLHGQPRQQSGHARHVAVVLAGLVGIAHVHLVDAGRVELVALHGGADHVGGEIVGAHGGEDAAIAADGSAEGVDDHRVGHGR